MKGYTKDLNLLMQSSFTMLLTKEDVIRIYEERKVVEELQKLESLLVVEDAISYLSGKPEDAVKEELASLRQKKDRLASSSSQKLQIMLFAQIEDPDNPRLDMLLPIQPRMSNQAIGKALFQQVSTVLDKYGKSEVTDYKGYVNIRTDHLSFQAVDSALWELSVVSPDLAKYNVGMGISRQYHQLSRAPSAVASLKEVGKDKAYLKEYVGYIQGIGAQEGKLTADDEDLEAIKTRLGEAADILGKRLVTREDGNSVYFHLEREPQSRPSQEEVGYTGKRGRHPSTTSLSSRIEVYIKEHGRTDVSTLVSAVQGVKPSYVNVTLSSMVKKRRLQRVGRGVYDMPDAPSTTGSYQDGKSTSSGDGSRIVSASIEELKRLSG